MKVLSEAMFETSFFKVFVPVIYINSHRICYSVLRICLELVDHHLKLATLKASNSKLTVLAVFVLVHAEITYGWALLCLLTI